MKNPNIDFYYDRFNIFKCDICGKFIPYKDIENNFAYRHLISPDSDFSCEEYQTLCKNHSYLSTVNDNSYEGTYHE